MNNFLINIKSIIRVAKNRLFSYKYFFGLCLLLLGLSIIWNIPTLLHAKNRIKNTHEIKVIAWDIHDVLVSKGFWKKAKDWATEFSIPWSKKTVTLALNASWQKDSIINSEELITMAQKEGQNAFAEFLIKSGYENWMPNKKVFEFIRELKDTGKYKLYICSNISKQSFERLVALNPEEFALFDGIFTTDLGTTKKPNPEFFKQFLKKFDLKAEEVLFIDDSKKNCQSARKLGMKAFVFKGTRTIQKIINSLKRAQEHSRTSAIKI